MQLTTRLGSIGKADALRSAHETARAKVRTGAPDTVIPYRTAPSYFVGPYDDFVVHSGYSQVHQSGR
jgi:hypothetical protein